MALNTDPAKKEKNEPENVFCKSATRGCGDKPEVEVLFQGTQDAMIFFVWKTDDMMSLKHEALSDGYV